MKPGSATFPFFGVLPAVVNDQGRELAGACEGHLVFKRPWPSIMRTVESNQKRFENTYFSKFPGYYWSGDGNLSFVLNFHFYLILLFVKFRCSKR